MYSATLLSSPYPCAVILGEAELLPVSPCARSRRTRAGSCGCLFSSSLPIEASLRAEAAHFAAPVVLSRHQLPDGTSWISPAISRDSSSALAALPLLTDYPSTAVR